MIIYQLSKSPFCANRRELEADYARLRIRLTGVGWISEGYMQDRGPAGGGHCYTSGSAR